MFEQAPHDPHDREHAPDAPKAPNAPNPTDVAALRTRVLILEAAMRCIEQEARRALEEPEQLSAAASAAVCRIAAVAAQARTQNP